VDTKGLVGETEGVPEDSLVLAFAPVHKRALGVAVGLVFGVVIFGMTAFHVILPRPDEPNLELLAQYFFGYEISWKGAFVGLFWGFITGFVTGWFIAFARNFAIAVRVFMVRTKAELSQTKDFLDHI
jgi:hypothetical protein